MPAFVELGKRYGAKTAVFMGFQKTVMSEAEFHAEDILGREDHPDRAEFLARAETPQPARAARRSAFRVPGAMTMDALPPEQACLTRWRTRAEHEGLTWGKVLDGDNFVLRRHGKRRRQRE